MTIIEGTQENFEAEVLKSEQKVLVDFNASWCGPCVMLKPIIEEIAASNDKVKIVSVDMDEQEELAEKYEVSSIPCLILFEKGEEVKRKIGLMPKKAIEKMIGE